MPENWKIYKLGEITSVITKGTTPSTYGFNFEDSGVNYIKAESLNYDGRVDENAFVHISHEAHEKLRRSKLQDRDILFSMAGAYLGKVGMVKKTFCPANTNQAVGIIRINNKYIDPKYVEYSLRNPSTVAYVNSQSGQSAQPNINLAEIGNLSFTFPPLPEQISIASILSAIDDKIELNLQMNKTLEVMAMTLYKHWFVDFGPFREGEFVDSELGRIPNGWEVKSTEDVFSVKDGTHDSPKQKDEGHFLITSKHIKKNEIDLSSAYKISSEDFLKVNQRSRVDNGDILMTMIGTVGVFYLVNEAPNYAIKNIGLFKTSEVPELKYYMFLFFNSDYSSQYIKSQLAGSTQQYLTLKVLRSFPFLHPTSDVLNEFNSIVSNYFEMIQNNIIENQTLTTLRDTLLPKLISGEVRLREFAQT